MGVTTVAMTMTRRLLQGKGMPRNLRHVMSPMMLAGVATGFSFYLNWTLAREWAQLVNESGYIAADMSTVKNMIPLVNWISSNKGLVEAYFDENPNEFDE